MKLAMVGAGAMGGALLGGWLAAGWSASEIVVVETAKARRAELTGQYGVECVSLAEAAEADTIVLAVKPHQFDAVLTHLQPRAGALVISIAAGVTIPQLEARLPEDVAVVRVMPNTGALVGQAMSGIVAGTNASADDVHRTEALLGAVGRTLVTDEAHLDALTAISGSGPAYLFYVADAMIEAGVHQGLTRAEATQLTVQTFVGSAALLAESGRDAVTLRAQVTSPAGTTAAALRTLDDHGVRAAFLHAVQACAERAAEMSGP